MKLAQLLRLLQSIHDQQIIIIIFRYVKKTLDQFSKTGKSRAPKVRVRIIRSKYRVKGMEMDLAFDDMYGQS
jgi:hypothetical protein